MNLILKFATSTFYIKLDKKKLKDNIVPMVDTSDFGQYVHYQLALTSLTKYKTLFAIY